MQKTSLVKLGAFSLSCIPDIHAQVLLSRSLTKKVEGGPWYYMQVSMMRTSWMNSDPPRLLKSFGCRAAGTPKLASRIRNWHTQRLLLAPGRGHKHTMHNVAEERAFSLIIYSLTS